MEPKARMEPMAATTKECGGSNITEEERILSKSSRQELCSQLQRRLGDWQLPRSHICFNKGKYSTQLKYSSRSVEELGLKQVKDCAIHEVETESRSSLRSYLGFS